MRLWSPKEKEKKKFPSHDFSTIILSGKGTLPSLSSLRSKIVANFPNISNHLAIDFSRTPKSRNIVIRVLLGSPVPAKDLFIFSASYENLFWMPLLSEILQSSFSVVTNIPLRYTDEDINELIHPLPASWNRLGNTLVQLNYSSLELQSITCCRGLSFNHRHVPASRVNPLVRVKTSDRQGAILQKKEFFRRFLKGFPEADIASALKNEEVFIHHFNDVRHFKSLIEKRKKKNWKEP
jgi:hypothetical protein